MTPDHYVTRLLHADGVGLDALGVGQGPLSEDASRAAWRLLCERWDLFRGTPVRFWLEAELAGIFGVTARPSKQTADAIYDQVAELPRAGRLPATGAVRPLRHHGPGDHRRPLLRPRGARRAGRRPGVDRAGDPDVPPGPLPRAGAARVGATRSPGWARPRRPTPATTPGYVRALEERRAALHRPRRDLSRPQPRRRADRPARARRGGAHLPRRAGRRRHGRRGDWRSGGTCWPEMARMSCDDGLVMALHPGVRRNHHRPTYERFGAGHRPRHPDPRRVHRRAAPAARSASARTRASTWSLFTVDETVWSRELAPLAGFYPSVYVGVPWWFLDAPDAIRRFRRRGDRDRRLLPDLRLRRRHPGLLLDPRPARHVPPRRRGRPGRAGRRAPAGRGRGGRDGDRPRHRQPAAVFKL